MVETLGTHEGRGDEDRPARLVHRHRVPAARVPRALPGAARDSCAPQAPPMPWKKVRKVLDEEWEEPVEELFEDFEHEAAAAASIGQVHRAVLPDGRRVAVKIQYPGVAEAIARRHAERRADPADGEGARARARRQGRRRGAQGARAWRSSTTSSRRRTSARSRAATAATRSSTCPTWSRGCRRQRVLVSEWVDGAGFEEVKAAAPGGARPLRRDRLPLLLRLDLPPPALQRRRPPRQLPADGRRQGRVPRLRHDQAARQGPDRARDHRARGGLRRRPRAAARGAARPRLPQQPAEGRRRAADGARQGRRRLVHGGPRGDDRLAPRDGRDRRRVRPALRVLPT